MLLTFLYWLPFVLVGLSLLSNVLLYLANRNEKDFLGLNEPKIKFDYFIIPMVVVFIGFLVATKNFKELWVSWLLFGISLVIHVSVEIYIRRLRSKAADERINIFMIELKESLEHDEK